MLAAKAPAPGGETSPADISVVETGVAGCACSVDVGLLGTRPDCRPFPNQAPDIISTSMAYA